MDEMFEDILATDADVEDAVSGGSGVEIGRSREGRPVVAYRLGDGPGRLSLIGGCHADEPVGPHLLRHLAAYLAGQPADSPLLRHYQWWIVPEANPDGAARNAAWSQPVPDRYDLARYLRDVVREAPGDDVEFGFPRSPDDHQARPENRAIARWWTSAGGPFALHVSLHGMAFAGGPWFLIERAWRDRCGALMTACEEATARLGYRLHDVERGGEKGFDRIGPGFATRPDSGSMIRFFQERGDEEMAARFRPSSMETMRELGGDTLTLVTEMPLFVLPGVGENLGPPDPMAERWREQIDRWRVEVQPPGGEERVRREVAGAGVIAVPVRDQMQLQWTMLTAGIRQL